KPVDGEQAEELVVEREKADFTSALAEDIVVFELVATNDGKVALNNVVITDELEGIGELICDREAPVTLLPGESLRCTVEYTLTDADISAGTLINTATATSDEVDAEPATIAVEIAPAMMARTIAPMALSGYTVAPGGASLPGGGDGGPYADAVTVIPGEYEFRSGWTEYNWSSKTCVANTTGGNWSGNTWVNGSWAGALGPGDHP